VCGSIHNIIQEFAATVGIESNGIELFAVGFLFIGCLFVWRGFFSDILFVVRLLFVWSSLVLFFSLMVFCSSKEVSLLFNFLPSCHLLLEHWHLQHLLHVLLSQLILNDHNWAIDSHFFDALNAETGCLINSKLSAHVLFSPVLKHNGTVKTQLHVGCPSMILFVCLFVNLLPVCSKGDS